MWKYVGVLCHISHSIIKLYKYLAIEDDQVNTMYNIVASPSRLIRNINITV